MSGWTSARVGSDQPGMPGPRSSLLLPKWSKCRRIAEFELPAAAQLCSLGLIFLSHPPQFRSGRLAGRQSSIARAYARQLGKFFTALHVFSSMQTTYESSALSDQFRDQTTRTGVGKVGPFAGMRPVRFGRRAEPAMAPRLSFQLGDGSQGWYGRGPLGGLERGAASRAQ